jgi:hypothetical protein
VKALPESYKREIEKDRLEKQENSRYSGKAEMNEEIDEPRFMEDATDETANGEDLEETWQAENQPAVADKISASMEDLERIQESDFIVSDEVRECIQDCLDCFRICNETTMRCLSLGGKHSESEHLNLLMDCARICNTNAEFMLRNSTYYPQTCGLTADICDECADTCDRFDDDFMKECSSVCRRCAESCREMAR